MREFTVIYKPNVCTFVVCDKHNGEVIHIHSCEAVDDARLPSDEEMKYEACKWAARRTGKAMSEIVAWKVRLEDLKPGVKYAVDLQTGALIEKRRFSHDRSTSGG